MPIADLVRPNSAVLHKTVYVPFPKVRTRYKRQRAFKRFSRVRQAETNPHPQRRNGIIPLNHFPEYVFKRNPPFTLSQSPLVESHQGRFDSVVTPRPAKPQINLVISPERLLSPRKRQIYWQWVNLAPVLSLPSPDGNCVVTNRAY